MRKRQIHDCPAEEPAGLPPPMAYRIETITPLFGGGVEAGVNDKTMPVSGSPFKVDERAVTAVMSRCCVDESASGCEEKPNPSK